MRRGKKSGIVVSAILFMEKRKTCTVTLTRHIISTVTVVSFALELSPLRTPWRLICTNIENKRINDLLVLNIRILDMVKSKASAEFEISVMMMSMVDKTGRKSWVCGECNFAGNKQEVFKHVDSKHYEYMCCCEHCGKLCQTWEGLRLHISRYHK